MTEDSINNKPPCPQSEELQGVLCGCEYRCGCIYDDSGCDFYCL